MLEFISMGEIKEEQLQDIACIGYRDKCIWLDKNQEFMLSPSGKTIYIVCYDKNKNIIGKKGFRVSSCIYYTEITD